MAYRFVVLLATIGAASASGVGYAAAPALLSAGPAIGYAKSYAAPALLAAPAPIAYAAPKVYAAAPVALAAPLAVPAAIQSHHHVQTYDVPISGNVQPITVDVPANVLPMNFVFRSASSTINVASKHEGAKGSFKETQSQDEPHVLKHTVTKPILQEVREIVSPFRKIQQTIEPVREEVQTLVAKGVGHLAAPVAAIAPTSLRVDAGVQAIGAARAYAVAAPSPVALAAPAPVALAAPALAADCGLGGLGCAQAGYGFLKSAAFAVPAAYKTGAIGLAAPIAAPIGYAGRGMKAW